MKIRNMLSSKGNRVANQFIVDFKHITVFQSYETVIAVYDYQTATLYQDEEYYSKTTSKYLNMFIRAYNPMRIFKVKNNELHKLIG